MSVHFENVSPGFNATITVHSSSHEFTSKIDISIHNVNKDIYYNFVLLQKDKIDNIDLLDTNGNHICTYKPDIIFLNNSLDPIIQTIITTCISVVSNTNNEEPLDEMIAKPCCIHHFQNEMFPSAFTGYNPKQILDAYNVNPNLSSVLFKPIITIVIAYSYPNLQKDFNTFCKLFSLSPSTLKIVTLDPNKRQNSGWAMEECLDVQWAYAMNPNAIIQVVEAKTSSFDDMFAAVQYASFPPPGSPILLPDVISMSWGATESGFQTNYDKFFSNSLISYVAATGDNNFPCYPATCPRVLAVGGTSLSLNTNNKRIKETTWSSAGCGLSSVYSKPPYQTNIPSITKYKKRVIPDLSGVANSATGVAVIYQGRQTIVGGTSVSTPIVAGILSISASKRKELKKQPFTTINNKIGNNLQQLLYSLYNTTFYKNNFYDVSIGYDGNFAASQGHDIATGLGVMNGQEITTTLINAK